MLLSCGLAVLASGCGEPRAAPPPRRGRLEAAALRDRLAPLLQRDAKGATARLLGPSDFRASLAADAPEAVTDGLLGLVDIRTPGDAEAVVLRVYETANPAWAVRLVAYLRGVDWPRGPKVPDRRSSAVHRDVDVGGATGFYEERRIHWREVNLRMIQWSLVVRREELVIEMRRRESLLAKTPVIKRRLGPGDDAVRTDLTERMTRVLAAVREALY